MKKIIAKNKHDVFKNYLEVEYIQDTIDSELCCLELDEVTPKVIAGVIFAVVESELAYALARRLEQEPHIVFRFIENAEEYLLSSVELVKENTREITFDEEKVKREILKLVKTK